MLNFRRLLSLRIFGLMLMLVSCSALANTYKIVIPLEELRAKTWTATSNVESDWVASGGPFGCSSWSPDPFTEYEGNSFEQVRTCSQMYERSVALMQKEVDTGETRVASVSNETKTGTITQSQYNIGMLDPWISTSSTYTAWANISSKDYDPWSPSASSQTSNFNQSRSYTQDQERYEQKREQHQETGDYRNVGDPIRHTRMISGTENRTIAVTSSTWSNVSGKYSCTSWSPSANNQTVDFVQNRNCQQDQARTWTYKAGATTVLTRVENQTITVPESRLVNVTNTGWLNDGSKYDCTIWSPSAGSQTTNFTQSMDCSQKQKRTWSYKVGATTIHTRTENQVITTTDNRSVTVSVSSWANSGSLYDCGSWSPLAGSQTSDFTQTGSCSQDQTRTWTYKAGATTIHTRSENQTVSASDTRIVDVTASGWTNSGTQYSCSSWSPSASTQTSSFTQSRSCSQDQTRSWYYKVGATTLHSRSESRTISVPGSRTISVTASSWSNSGSVYSCSTWSPHPNTVDAGKSFTQTRSCSQNQNRNWTYKAGATTIHSRGQSRVISVAQSRSATGTKVVIECLGGGWGSNTFHPPLSGSGDYVIWFKGDIVGNSPIVNRQSNPYVKNGKRYWAGSKISNYRGGEYKTCHYKGE